MKAIIFTSKPEATEALAECTAAMPQGAVSYEGEGPFLPPDLNRPYSTIIKHPTQAKWALIADGHVEDILGVTAEELDRTWFPQSAMS